MAEANVLGPACVGDQPGDARQPDDTQRRDPCEVTRQPDCPIRVPSGTPTTFPTVRPLNIITRAPAFRSRATSSVATTEPMPKRAPCASEATTRPSSMTE